MNAATKPVVSPFIYYISTRVKNTKYDALEMCVSPCVLMFVAAVVSISTQSNNAEKL